MNSPDFTDYIQDLCTNPWAPHILAFALVVFMAGLGFIWVYTRLAHYQYYRLLGSALIGESVYLALFFHHQLRPNFILLWAEIALGLFILGLITAGLVGSLVEQARLLGVEDKYLFRPSDHSVLIPYAGSMALVVYFLLYYFLPGLFILTNVQLRNDFFLTWGAGLASFAVIAATAWFMVPYEEAPDMQKLMSKTYRELVPLLTANVSDVSLTEKICVPIGTAGLAIIMCQLMGGISGVDVSVRGILFVVLIIGSIMLVEQRKNQVKVDKEQLARMAEARMKTDEQDRKRRFVEEQARRRGR